MTAPESLGVVVTSPEQLRELITLAVAEALEAHQPVDAPKLLDRARLALALGVSLPTLDALRREPSFPELRVGDAPRFELDRVLTWLRARQTPGLRLVGGDHR